MKAKFHPFSPQTQGVHAQVNVRCIYIAVCQQFFHLFRE